MYSSTFEGDLQEPANPNGFKANLSISLQTSTSQKGLLMAEEEQEEEEALEVEKQRYSRVTEIRKLCREWIKNPMNITLVLWITCVTISGAILFLVITGMLDKILTKKSQKDLWFEVNNQILNALFTLMCLYQHPKRFHHLALLCRYRHSLSKLMYRILGENAKDSPFDLWISFRKVQKACY